jgi:2-desacetyl-2-hydroxyethyl bacteriochlorophyllide A dehydrogenase
MKAALMDVVVCRSPGQLVAEQRPIPAPGNGEVLIRVKRVGVCGTDMHIFRGTQPYLAYPRIIGHEISGLVERVPGSSRLRPGDPVSIIPYLSCGACSACAKGKPNCCLKLEVLGVHRDGGFAGFVSVPESAVCPLEGLSLEDGVTIEFLAIGAHAVKRADVRPGQRVLVCGAGPIGIACCIFAGIRGADVVVLDTRRDRLTFCSDVLGVSHAWSVGSDTREKLAELTDGDMFDVVFDATGNPKAMQAGFHYIAHGGTYVLVSVVSADITFSDPEFHKREATLMGSRNATAEDFAYVRDEISAGKIPTAALRTHSAALLEMPQALVKWMTPETGVIKGVVEC